MQHDANPSARPEHPPDSTSFINRVGIRVPPVRPEKSAVWFSQLEGQFAVSSSYRTRQNLLRYFAVGEQVRGGGAGRHNQPPPTGRYDRIKAELIRRLSLSEEQRFRQLLMHEEMGDRSPTQFLRYLRTLAGPSVHPDFLRTLWINRLPPNIRPLSQHKRRSN